MSHAVLSPSAASRWLACTPSARLELQFPDKSSDFAREGTLAHGVGEKAILNYIAHGDFLASELESDALSQPDYAGYYSPEMLEFCLDYARLVIEKFNAAKKLTPDAILKIEERIDISAYVPECFGTGDAIIIADGVMEIIDLKYGKGVEVSAVENKQMMLYALGSLHAYSWLYDIHSVRMTIYQPRINNISEWDFPASEILTWGESIKQKAAIAFEGGGEQVSGPHCKFCKAKAQCRELAIKNVEAAKNDFMLLSSEEIAAILPQVDGIKNWVTAIEEYTLNAALEGTKFPGFKLVEGRSVRKYADEAKVVETLTGNGFNKDQLFEEPKLKTITAMEKLITKKTFSALLSDLVVKPQGKPTLVPADDKRAEWRSVETDFNNVGV